MPKKQNHTWTWSQSSSCFETHFFFFIFSGEEKSWPPPSQSWRPNAVTFLLYLMLAGILSRKQQQNTTGQTSGALENTWGYVRSPLGWGAGPRLTAALTEEVLIITACCTSSHKASTTAAGRQALPSLSEGEPVSQAWLRTAHLMLEILTFSQCLFVGCCCPF